MSIVSKSDFAEIAQVGKSAVSNLIRKGKLPTVDGGIDLGDLVVQAYLVSKNIRVDARPGRKAAKKKTNPARLPPKTKDWDRELIDLTSIADKTVLERKKLAAQTQQLELKNAQIEGRLVAREVMIRGVWNPLETFLVRILSDGAKTMAASIHPLVKSGGTREEVEVAIRSELTSFIVPLKESIKKALKLEDV